MSPSWWQLDWIWTAAGWTLAAIGAALLLWSLFWDRPRGRKRCPKCWYDMSAAPGPICPECGRVIHKPKHLLRTHRRWGGVPAAFVVLASSYAAFLVPPVQRRGWPAAIPDVVLAWATPLDGPYWPANPGVRGDGRMLRELQRRVDDRELSAAGYRVFLSRYFDRCPEERKRVATTRAVWPRGEHVYAELWWPNVLWQQTDDLVVRARLRGSESWAEGSVAATKGIQICDLGPMPSDGRAGEIQLEIVRIRPAVPSRSRPEVRSVLYRGAGPKIGALPQGEDGLTLVVDPDLSDAIIRGWDPEVRVDTDGQPLLRTHLLGSHLDWRNNWSLSVTVELLRGPGVLAKQSFVEYMPGPGEIVDFFGIYGYRRLLLSAPMPLDASSGPFRLRITGDRRMALRDVNRTSLWAGSFEVPLGTGALLPVDTTDPDYRRWQGIRNNK